MITEQLSQRPARAADYAAEARAMGILALEIAARPRTALHKLAGLAIELCRADAAGVSILEPHGNTELMCSRAIAGTFGGCVDAVIPRHASPCGMALASNTALLFSSLTEQRFPTLRNIDPPIFETLVAPIRRDSEAIGAVWALSHDPDRKFDAEDARLLNRLAHLASAAHQMVAALDIIGSLQQEAVVRARIEEGLRQTQKMEAIGQLTGGIAHDFNNKLQSIGGSLEMLQRRVEQGRMLEAIRYIETARSEVERAAAFTHQLLASARQQTLQPKLVTLGAYIGGIAKLIQRAAGPGIKVEFALSGRSEPVLCDPRQLESALLNLAVNARDAMPGGGVLTIATTNRLLTAADLLSQDGARPGGYAEVSVADSGTGMAASIVERAFEPFFTTKPVGQGTGLGLSQIYGFARQSGGLTWLESAPGEGTTVRLLLPHHVADAPASAVPVPQRPGARTGYDSMVLLVEDDLPVLLTTGYPGAAVDVQLAPGMEVINKPFTLDMLAGKARGIVEAAAYAPAVDGGLAAAD